jgi:hypothetical protein
MTVLRPLRSDHSGVAALQSYDRVMSNEVRDRRPPAPIESQGRGVQCSD